MAYNEVIGTRGLRISDRRKPAVLATARQRQEMEANKSTFERWVFACKTFADSRLGRGRLTPAGTVYPLRNRTAYQDLMKIEGLARDATPEEIEDAGGTPPVKKDKPGPVKKRQGRMTRTEEPEVRRVED